MAVVPVATATLANLVSRAAAQAPHSTAVVGSREAYTWSEADRSIASLARRLLADGVVPGSRVAIACLKDALSFLAVHAALRVGATVVPVDPLAPTASAWAVLHDADVSGIIGDRRTMRGLDPWSIGLSNLRSVIVEGASADPGMSGWVDDSDQVGGSSAESELVGGVEWPEVAPDDPAYIIYTSGSTGSPKGIVHTHASALAYAERAVAAHGLRPDDRVAAMSPLHFDMSTLELYAAPLAGAAIVTIGEALMRFPASFTERCAEESVTLWYTVPSFLRQVVERGAIGDRDLSALRSVMYGGEPYPPGALRSLIEALPHVQVTNVYGPAEVNECTYHVVSARDLDRSDIPIGRPWDGAAVQVWSDGSEVEPGTPGELWVSTVTLMAGYWRQSELTGSKLRRRDDGPDWYATGDVVAQDSDGVLWFKGRRDHQVKVRGVRLELEAVESVIEDGPNVLAAVVGRVADPEGDRLVAAVVFGDAGAADVGAVREWCAKQLPQVARPARIDVWHDLPRTPSGKIDRAQVRRARGATTLG